MSQQPQDAKGLARQALGSAVASYGISVLGDHQALREALTRLLPNSPRERSLLTAAAGADVAGRLRRHIQEGYEDVGRAVQEVARELAERTAIEPTACLWATAEFARVLGYPDSSAVTLAYATQPMLDEQPPPAQPAPQQWAPPQPGFGGYQEQAACGVAGAGIDPGVQHPMTQRPGAQPAAQPPGAPPAAQPPGIQPAAQAPEAQQPAAQLADMQQPAVQQPGVHTPGVQPQGFQQPGVQQPGVHLPGVQQPGVQQPGVQSPGVQQPGVQSPGVQQPGVQSPGVQQPGVQQPGMQPRGFQQPGMQPQGYQQAMQPQGYQQPAYGQLGVHLPGVQQPGMQPQGYQQAGYQQPGMQPPGIQQPAAQPGGWWQVPPGQVPPGPGGQVPGYGPPRRSATRGRVLLIVGVAVIVVLGGYVGAAAATHLFPFHRSTAAPLPRPTIRATHHPATPSPTPTPTSTVAALPPGKATLTELLPGVLDDPASQCSPILPPYRWAMSGVVQALQCDQVPGLHDGTVFAFQLDSASNYLSAWGNYNQWWGFNGSAAGTSCPPSSATGEGTVSWSGHFFPQHDGQVLECEEVSGNQPAYTWTIPSEFTFIAAQGAPGSSFSSLQAWWTQDAGPNTAPTPATP